MPDWLQMALSAAGVAATLFLAAQFLVTFDPEFRRWWFARLARRHGKRALSRTEAGDFDAAIAEWTRAIDLYPEEPSYHFDRALARGLTGHLTGAISDCDSVLLLDPSRIVAYALRGVCLGELGLIQDGMDDLERALRLAPANWEHLAWAEERFRELERLGAASDDGARAA